MEIRIFYSWLSDLPDDTNQHFIEEALRTAATNAAGGHSLKIEPVLDRDANGIGGSPNILHEILEKIDQCDIFVCDISIINHGAEFRRTPNPNVMFELGYALKTRGWKRIILIMNDAYGSYRDLPFDLEKRRIVPFTLNKDGTGRKNEVRRELEKKIEIQIGMILKEEQFQSANPSEENVDKTERFLEKAKKLEEQKQFEKFREQWLHSVQGLEDVHKSVSSVIELIKRNYRREGLTFKGLGINLIWGQFVCTLENPEYGCKVELRNFENISSLSGARQRLFLELRLCRKTFIPAMGGFTETVKEKFFYPDINFERKVFWEDSRDRLDRNSPEEICKLCFEWMIDQIEDPLPTVAEREELEREREEKSENRSLFQVLINCADFKLRLQRLSLEIKRQNATVRGACFRSY
jgi:hypothetical protein